MATLVHLDLVAPSHALVRDELNDSHYNVSLLILRRHKYQWCSISHPFIQGSDRAGNSHTFRSLATGALYKEVADHVVRGQVVFPGTGYLELARAACHAAWQPTNHMLHAVFIMQPLSLVNAQTDSWVHCTVDQGMTFEICSGLMELDDLRQVTVHSKGDHSALLLNAPHLLDLCGRRRGVSYSVDMKPSYLALNDIGLQYGPYFQRLARIWISHACDEGLANLQDSPPHGMHVHPASIDSTQHLQFLMTSQADGAGPLLPFAYDEVSLRLAKQRLMSVRLIQNACHLAHASLNIPFL